MAKVKLISLTMSDAQGTEWVNVITSEVKAKRLVKLYSEQGLALRATYKSVAA